MIFSVSPFASAVNRLRTFLLNNAPHLTRSTLVMRILLFVCLGAFLVPFVTIVAMGAYSFWPVTILCAAMVGIMLSGWLLYRGLEAASATALLITMWFAATAFLIVRGGVRLPILQFYAVIVVASVFLLGKRAGLFSVVLTVLTTALITWAEFGGLLPTASLEPAVWRILTVNFTTLILLTAITYLISADVEHSVSLARTATKKSDERRLKLEERTQELEEVNANLAASERRYRHFFNHTPVMVHSIDQQGRLVDVNEYWLNTLGYQHDEVIGRRSTEFLTPESQRYAVEVALPQYFANGFIKDVAYQMVKKNGDVIDVLLSGSELLDEDGNFLHSLASIVDITAQKRVEADLRESEQRFRTVVNSAADCFLLLNPAGHLIAVNDYTCQTLGYTQDELLGMPLTEFDAEWTAERMAKMGERLEVGVAETVTSTLIHKDGTHIPVEIRVVVTTIDNEPVFLGLARDVTVQREAQIALQTSEHRFRSIIFNQAQQFISLLEPNGIIFEVNQSALEFGDLPKDEVIGQFVWGTPWWRSDPVTQERLANAVHVAAQGELVRYEMKVQSGDGGLITIDFSLTPIRDEKHKIIWLLAEGRDITEFHRSQQALAQTVQEKELLLKEIHHRVKNNLQIVSSILRLQADKTQEPTILTALNESQSRIRSMQIIHEQLYHLDNISHINLAAYCQQLAAEASRLYRAPSTKINYQLDLVDLDLDIDKATTCGLILNEMISNALKYAFPEGASGTITVELRAVEEQVYLSVSDNGIGIAPEIPFPNPTSLGFRLIELLSAQIGANVTLIRQPQTKFELLFDPN